MNLEKAEKLYEGAVGDNYADYDQIEISADEVGKIDSQYIETLGEDFYYVPESLDPDGFGLETDWADKPCIVGPSGGDPTRSVVYL